MNGQPWLNAAETWLAHFFGCRLKRRVCRGHQWLDIQTGQRGVTMYDPYMLLEEWENE